jgi:hypothetical protein
MFYGWLFALTLTSCHNAAQKETAATPVPAMQHPTSYVHEKSRLLLYVLFLADLDTEKVAMSGTAFREFQKLFTGQPPEVSDSGFALFYSFQQRLGSFLQRSPMIDSVKRKLAANSFMVYEEEGFPYIVTSWPLITKRFSAYVSPTMNEILAEKVREQKEGFQRDAAIVINAEQFARRIVWWEQFAVTHPQFIYSRDARAYYVFLLKMLLTGMDNTPVAENDSLASYYRDTYTFIGEHFPTSYTNAVIAPYLKAWQVGDTATIRKMQRGRIIL